MRLNSIVTSLYETRPELTSIQFSNNDTDYSQKQGKFIEYMVRKWIRSCKLVQTDIPNHNPNFEIKQDEELGFNVIKQGRTLINYDLICIDSDTKKPIIGEVKSWRLNGYTGKIGKAIKIGQELFEVDELGLLLFMPFVGYHKELARLIEEEHNNVKCVNLGYYNRKEIKRAIQK